MALSIAPTVALRAIQHPVPSHSFAALKVSSAQLLRDDAFRPTWVYEIKGTLNGKPVRLLTDENKLGDVRLDENGKTRQLTRAEKISLRTALTAYSKAQNYNPPQGVQEAIFAVNETLAGPAPMNKFKPTGIDTWTGGGWDQGLTVNGAFPGSKDSVSITFRSSSATNTSDLSLFWQHNASSTRSRPMVRSELEAAIRALTPMAAGADPQARLYGTVLAAAKKQLAAMQPC